MKYCIYCGHEIEGNEKFCTSCGKELTDDYPIKTRNATSNGNSDTIQLIAFIFMIISLVFNALLLIPLIWRIPMLLKYRRHMTTGEPISTGYKVCTLLFVDVIAGICTLVEK